MGSNGTSTDLTGQRFGALVVLRRVRARRKEHAMWYCQCDCGREVQARADNLQEGRRKSCGIEHYFTRNKKRRSDARAEYTSYQAMKQRCYNPNAKAFKHYGAKGVVVCARWLESFDNFLADMGRRPSIKHSLDRYPVRAGNYEPTNCRWATAKQQGRNRDDCFIVDRT